MRKILSLVASDQHTTLQDLRVCEGESAHTSNSRVNGEAAQFIKSFYCRSHDIPYQVTCALSEHAMKSN